MIRMQSYNQLVEVTVITLETLLCGAAFQLFCLLLDNTHWAKVLNAPKLQIVLTLMLCYLLCSAQRSVMLYKRKVYAYQIVTVVCWNVCSYAVLAGVILAIGDYMDVWSYFFAGYIGFLFVCMLAFRLGFRFLIKRVRLGGKDRREVLLVGSTENNLQLYYELTSETWAGYDVAGYFDNAPNPDFPKECPYRGKPQAIIDFLKAHGRIRDVFCCLPPAEKDIILQLINYCENHLVHFYSVPDVHNYFQNQMYLERIGMVPYLTLRREPLSRLGNQVLKRSFDIAFSLLFLCTLFPAIWLVVAVVTKSTMPGPVFFRQKRNGLDDKEFYCYKFRSMRVNTEADNVQATRDDPRVTRWGHFLRRSNLDETPQFFNVLRGDMSIVGPRPHMLKHTEEYSKLINKYMVRHYVKPGITGWSQVSGFRGETKALGDMENRIRNDIWYIEHWSFMLDLYIIYKTLANAIRGEENAY
ncbi:MAG TPA: undecaprenyl-phosphate glucose phosphotransferase [Candidatus Bacteroides merdipullorum]|uniref:Undecaprenyl-phosphate glucose phosphotransferase n=1 Tax=Candidatus Bacteroides merdipullorum TaxID=2838474 RepID=A0A9D2A2T4_9BACE|nr:undecaprenyl-phosphate glucose phosphotransferase [Candidatus Bacteroides merdipullorum]